MKTADNQSVTNNSTIRLYACALAASLLMLAARPASAQYRPRPLNDPATGEVYRIEGSAAFWFPTADLNVSSEALGIQGTVIDFKRDFGVEDKPLPALKVVLRASQRNKFRAEFIPIKYETTTTLKTDLVFNGQRYQASLPTTGVLEWTTYRVAYEFDVVSTNRGYGGIVLDAKYTDVRVQLTNQVRTDQAHAQAPIPSLGGIVRVYVVPNISITGEVSGVKLPDNIIQNTEFHYLDFDIYGTINFTNNIGAQVGYRSLDVGYLLKADTGSFVLRGAYVGVVARY